MFAGKIWWITGASSGIGATLAESLAQRGAKLILSGRNVAALKDVAARCKHPTHNRRNPANSPAPRIPSPKRRNSRRV